MFEIKKMDQGNEQDTHRRLTKTCVIKLFFLKKGRISQNIMSVAKLQR